MQKVSERGLASGRLATSDLLPGWRWHAAGRLDRAAVPPGRRRVSWGTLESSCFPRIPHGARRTVDPGRGHWGPHRPPARCSRGQEAGGRPGLTFTRPLRTCPLHTWVLSPWGVVTGRGIWASATLSAKRPQHTRRGAGTPTLLGQRSQGRGRQGRLWPGWRICQAGAVRRPGDRPTLRGRPGRRGRGG